jgi:hypothetical protein
MTTWSQTSFVLALLQLVYMSDVLDHISTIVEDMETLAEDARDLIDLVFNTIGEQWRWPLYNLLPGS